ncbi:MAG: zinc-finger domain-containing protein [Bdellovibrionales bacterium]
MIRHPAPETEPLETITVSQRTIGCDGGAGASTGALGHPLTYLTIGNAGTVDCGYCGRRFVLDPHADNDGH